MNPMPADTGEQADREVMLSAGASIAALTPHPGRRSYYQIVLDSHETAVVHEDVIVALELRVGRMVTPELVQSIAREGELARAREAALSLLKVRARSRAELVRRLRQKGFEPDVVAAAMAKLENLGLVDDAQFARDLARSLLRRQSCGRQGLLYRLRSSGVGSEVAESVVAETLEGVDETERAAEALHKRLPRWEKLSPRERRMKAYQLLARLGFDGDTISDALSATLADE